MKAKRGYSDLDNRKYVDKVLVIAGILASAASLAVAWPALSHIGATLLS